LIYYYTIDQADELLKEAYIGLLKRNE